MYRLSIDPNLIIRKSDGAYIPKDPLNRNFREYENWLSKGNIPENAEQNPHENENTLSVEERITLLLNEVEELKKLTISQG